MPTSIGDLSDDLLAHIICFFFSSYSVTSNMERPRVAILVSRRWHRLVWDKCIRAGRVPNWHIGCLQPRGFTHHQLEPFTHGIVHLNLSGRQQIGLEGFHLLGAMLIRPGTRLRFLDLTATGATDAGVGLLLPGLSQPSCRLTRLYLSWNVLLGKKSAQAILATFRLEGSLQRVDFFGCLGIPIAAMNELAGIGGTYNIEVRHNTLPFFD